MTQSQSPVLPGDWLWLFLFFAICAEIRISVFVKTRSRTKCVLKGLGYPNKDAKRADTDIFALLAD
jgi:hypothetical protein